METPSALWFHPPVAVRGERPGITRQINNVQWAAEVLLEWPIRGPLWRHAVEVCLEALALEVEPEVARDAFREAAAEEGMLMPNLDGPLGVPLTSDRKPKPPRNRKPK